MNESDTDADAMANPEAIDKGLSAALANSQIALGLRTDIHEILVAYLQNTNILPGLMVSTAKAFQSVSAEVFRHYNNNSYMDVISNIGKATAAISKMYLDRGPAIGENFLHNIVTPQVELFQNWARDHSNIFESFRNLWQGLDDEYSIAEKEAVKVLRRYKWFIAPNMPLSFIYEVVRLGKRRGDRRKDMNQLFVGHFLDGGNENLNRYIDDWCSNELFAKRRRILRDCSKLLEQRRRNFNSCTFILPVLISQIDGIKHDLLVRHGLSPRNTKWQDGDGNNVNWKDYLRNTVVVDEMDDLASELLLAVLFQTAYPGVPLKNATSFNRHKILHGESTNYGRIDNVIRAFMLIDFLAAIE